MLSTRAFSSSGAAGKYYTHSDYYGSEAKGTWLGDGAKELGLTGEFNAKDNPSFNNLLKGILPNGQILGKKTKAGIEHTPGVDLTFSVPKSFSIQMLVLSEKQERQAMEVALTKAVNTTLKYIEEKGYAVARKGAGGHIKEKIHKLSFATFLHTTNRNLEPQAHVHCFLTNSAKCEDGNFRSLTFENILKNNKFLGQVFRNELALETKKIGYDITPTVLSDGSSAFELSKIDNKLIQAFSTRRQEIEELCKLYGVKTKEGRDNIVINSRKAKKLVNQDELNSAWRTLEQKVSNEVANQAVNDQQQNNSNLFKQAWDFLISKLNPKLDNPYKELTLEELVKLCVEDATHKTSVVSFEDLLKKSLKFSIGNYSVSDLEQEFKKLEAKGIILGNNGLYTTKALVTKEKEILKYATEAIGASKEIVKQEYLSAHIEKYERMHSFKMNEQQRNTIGHILTSKDKIITIEGLPGVGKSTVLDSVRSISGQKILKFEGLAPTGSAAKTLKESANLDISTTIHCFLGQYQGYLEGRGTKRSLQVQRKIFKNVVIFVDECSLIPTHIMHKLLTLQKKFDYRLVLTGDTKQLGAVEAGKPFEQILKIIKPAVMNKIVRQKSTQHKQAVIAASQGNIDKTFAIHKENIKELPMLPALAKEAASLYVKKDPTQREQTLLIAPTRNLRDQINLNIKNELKLPGEKLEFSALRQRDMTIADYQFAPSFQQEIDILRFHRPYKKLGIVKDEYLTVKKVNHISNSLILKKENGKEVLFQLRKEVDYKSKFEVFNKLGLDLQQGLKIIFTKNNQTLGLINSETAIIKSINKNTATLQFENKMIKDIPMSQLKHVDYGYCVTVHTSQGKTFNNTIAAIGKNIFLNNQQSWLVSLSRHRAELSILSEGMSSLKTYLHYNTGKEMSALELVSKTELKTTAQVEKNTQVNKSQIINSI
jgi:conjugative relaxase-like TrwC/TraI family protein